jgi:hypothetical protein
MLCVTVMKILCSIIAMAFTLQTSIASAAMDYREEIPFVPTPITVVDRMLELAGVNKADLE